MKFSYKQQIVITLLLSLIQFLIALSMYLLNTEDILWPLFCTTSFLTLAFNIGMANRNPISSLYSIGVLLYYFQLPFIKFFPNTPVSVYNLNYQDHITFEFYLIYSFILSIQILITLYFSQLFKDYNTFIIKIINSSNLGGFSKLNIIIACLTLTITIYQNGGIINYLVLNKFEATEASRFLGFFTWKDFAVIGITTFVLSKSKNWLFTLLIISLITVEILTAKRLLLLITAASIYLTHMKTFKFQSFLYCSIAILFLNLIKYTYYSLQNIFTNKVADTEIFWFQWSDFFRDSLLTSEFSAHLRLTYLYLSHDISLPISDFFNQFFAAIPLSGTILQIDYLTAGERLRVMLNEPWSGLASSMYTSSFLSLGILGIILMYLIFVIYITFLYTISKKFNLIGILFISLSHYLFFYLQREEFLLAAQNTYVYSAILIFMFWALKLPKIKFLKK